MLSGIDRKTKAELRELLLRSLDRLERAGIGLERGPIEAATEARVDALDLDAEHEAHGQLAVRLASILDSGAELRSEAALSKEWRALMAEIETAARAGAADDDDDDDELTAEVIRMERQQTG